MRFDILTIFPSFFESPLKQGILKRAQDRGLIEINIHDIRDYALDKHRMTDDYPYGGGEGMVMKVEPIYRAVVEVKKKNEMANLHPWLCLLTPQGRPFNQAKALELSKKESLTLICGRYQGVDERVRELVVDEEISIGDYILSGGESAALVVIDAVSRLVEGVVGCKQSIEEDSFSMGLLEYPHYTRPVEFMGLKVPDILISGNHKEIMKWRRMQSIKRTYERRPELLKDFPLKEEDIKILEGLKKIRGINYGYNGEDRERTDENRHP